MKRRTLIMSVMIFLIIIFATSGCGSTKYNYETEISSVSFPNDGSSYGDMFFDEENNLCSYFKDTFAIPEKYNIFSGNYSNLFLETKYDLNMFSNTIIPKVEIFGSGYRILNMNDKYRGKD